MVGTTGGGGGGGGVPSGAVIMWSGTTTDIPDGWTLCDGSDSTPDLRDRFVTGAGGQYAADETGGSDTVTLTESEMPSHDHTGSTSYDGNHSHTVEGATSGSREGDNYGGNSYLSSSTSTKTTSTDGSHSHSVDIDPAGSDSAHENRPPYLALAFIMKT